MNKDEIAGLVERLMSKVFGNLTPGAIDHADLDGMAFLVEDAADALTTLSAENEALRHDVQRQMAIAIEHVNESATLSARVETLEAGMSQYLKDGQTPLERMEQDQADILGLMKLLQKEKELTEKLRWALSDAVTTNTESCRERDAALHRIEAARLGIIEGRRQAFEEALEALNDDEVAEAMDCNKVEKYAVHKSAIKLAKEAIRALIEESRG